MTLNVLQLFEAHALIMRFFRQRVLFLLSIHLNPILSPGLPLFLVHLETYLDHYEYKSLFIVLSRFSRVRLCATLWTAACQAPLSMRFSRQEYERVVMPFSRGSTQPRDRTSVSCLSCITGRFFTTETLKKPKHLSLSNSN